MWGVLPLRYLFNPDNMRWGLASYDLCFTNKCAVHCRSIYSQANRSRAFSTFFTLGQLLPTHRGQYSEFGGLFQPTVTQAIRLLSRGPFLHVHKTHEKASKSLRSPDLSDPFTSGHLTFSTNGVDTFPAPSAYLTRRHSWIHIFPEGRIHQEENRTMRYFKWGVSRLILESEPCPDVVPIWLEGVDQIMHETRTFPRFLPRPFKDVSITFGKKLDTEKEFGDLRARWKQIREKEEKESGPLAVGELNEALKESAEARQLRIECTRRIRQAVLDVRRSRGWPDGDPKATPEETYAIEGGRGQGKKDDGSLVRDA
jgi:monolysocardiolipin acyltransferase